MTDQREQARAAKEWLLESAGLILYVNALERRLAAVTFANVSQYESDGVHVEPKENVQETKFLEYSELRRQLDDAQDRYKNHAMEMVRMIGKVENNTEKSVLFERYVNGLTWGQVAVKTNFGKRYVQTIHGQALLSLFKVLEKESIL